MFGYDTVCLNYRQFPVSFHKFPFISINSREFPIWNNPRTFSLIYRKFTGNFSSVHNPWKVRRRLNLECFMCVKCCKCALVKVVSSLYQWLKGLVWIIRTSSWRVACKPAASGAFPGTTATVLLSVFLDMGGDSSLGSASHLAAFTTSALLLTSV